jgi:hypothetical protein
MQTKTIQFQNLNYTIKPFNAVDGVIIFQVLKPSLNANVLDLEVMYGWVNKKLVDLTARNNENGLLLDTCRQYILSTYRFN